MFEVNSGRFMVFFFSDEDNDIIYVFGDLVLVFLFFRMVVSFEFG